jgi:hypothetical protein
MKKIILSIVSIASAGLVLAQSSITLEGSSTVLSGSAYTENLTTAVNDLHVIDFIVHNESGSNQQWKITRKHIDNPAGWSEYLCWGLNGAFGNCYPVNSNAVWTCGSEMILADSSGRLSTYVTAPSGGTAQYRYYVSTDGINYLDSVDVIVNNAVGLDEKASFSVSIAPNPASDNLTISTTGVGESNVRIVDVLGNLVLNEKVFSSKKTLDISRFRNGVYFVTVESEGVKPVTRKVIVRH